MEDQGNRADIPDSTPKADSGCGSAQSRQSALPQDEERTPFSAQVQLRATEQALAARTRQLEAIRTVSIELTQELDLGRLLRLLIARAAELVGASSGTVYLRESGTDDVVPAAWHGLGDWQAALRHSMGQGIAGTVAQTGQGLCVNDYRTSAYANPISLSRTRITASLGEPLLYREELLGAITVNHEEGRKFTPEDQGSLRLFAAHAAVAVANARLFEERKRAETALAQRTRQLEAVSVATAEIVRELDLSTALQLITRRACELAGATAGNLYLWDETAQRLIRATAYGRAVGREAPPRRLGEGILGRVAERREGIRIDDYRSCPWAYPITLAQTQIRAVLTEPLLYGGELLGVLGLDREDAGNPFTDPDHNTLKLLATQAAIAIENARLYGSAQRELKERKNAEHALRARTKQLEAIGAVSAEITRELDLTRLLQLIHRRAADLLGAQAGFVSLYDEATRTLIPRAWSGHAAWVAGLSFRLGEGISGLVAQQRRGIVVADYRTSPYTLPLILANTNVTSVVAEPLLYRDRLVGVVTVDNQDAEGRSFTEADREVLAHFATHAAIAIENARLHAAAQQELGERREAEVALAQRTRQLEAVRAVSAEIARVLDLPRVLELITHRAVEMVGASSGILRLWDDAQQLLVAGAWTGEPSQVPTASLRLGEGVSGEAARRRQGLYNNDFRSAPYTIPALLDGSLHTAVMAAPLLHRERLVGVLAITRNATDPAFTDADLQTLELLVPQTAIAIENARLYEAAQQELVERTRAEDALAARTSQLEAIRTVTSEITRELHLPVLLQLITQRASELLGDAAGAFFLWDEQAQQLVPQGWYGTAHREEHRPRRLGEGLVGAVAAERKGICTNDYRSSTFAVPYVVEHSDITAAIAEPLLYHDRLLGVVSLNNRGKSRQFSQQDQDLLRLFANQAAIAVENARLFAEVNDSYARVQAAQDELVRTEKLRALGQMAAGVAHDLNNMLAAILGQAELLRLRVKLPEVQEALQVLYTAASDGAQVVRRLQEFGRQKTSTHLVPCDLGPIVQEALELTRPRWQDEAQRLGRTIRACTDLEGLPRILGHPAEIREALTNLILNAVDAMPKGGTLTIAGVSRPASEPTDVCLGVTDTGIGMSEDVQRHIFDPFYTTKGLRGTGLGLAVVYGILERHGGHIDVRSTPEKGTTFTLRFRAASSTDEVPVSSARARRVDPRRILVIDDEAAVRTTIASLLRAGGHTVAEAESGAAGVAHLAAHAVDLVITDLGMPEMTGWDVAQRVKTDFPSIPVVLLTGWGEQISGTAPGQACVDRIMAKPARFEALQDAIGALSLPGGSTPPVP